MNEETREQIKQHFESNFLDGDKMPCKAVTFTDSGALDVAEYFYELAIQAECERLMEKINKCGEYKFGSMTGDTVYVNKAELLNLINNK